MPRLIKKLPAYSKHRASGQAVVTLSGVDVYLGAHGTKVSKGEYDRVIAEWLVNGRRQPVSANDNPTVTEVIYRYLIHAQEYYRHNVNGVRMPTGELAPRKLALSVLKDLYGSKPAAAFDPLALEAVRAEMIRRGWRRKSINVHISRIKHLFKWASAKQLVPSTVYHGLLSVSALQKDRTDAVESKPVEPVADALVEATLPFMSAVVAAMVRTQLLTAARPGEIAWMRVAEIDRSNADVWTYTPIQHKTAYRGHTRTIFIGPKAQAVLRPFLLKTDPQAFVFRPAESVAEMRQRRSAARKTPLSYGNRPGSNVKRKPKRVPSSYYKTSAYRRAITRACDLADRWAHGGMSIPDNDRIVPRWHPHQLRHTAATALRGRHGLEGAQVILGHKTLTATQIYAEINLQKGVEIAGKTG
jgi:integrase